METVEQLLTQIRDSLKSLADSHETLSTLELWEAPWLTPELASRILPMSAAGIREAARVGAIPAKKFRGKWMVDPRATAKAIESDREHWRENTSARKVRAKAKADELFERVRKQA